MKTLHYINLNLSEASSDLLVAQVDLLRQAVRLSQKQFPFGIDTAVVLPNAFCAILVLPEGDMNCAARWNLIKVVFARHAAGAALIWQSGAGHRHLQTRADYEKHQHLIVTSPVRAGLVSKPTNWPLSSFARLGRADMMAPLGSEPLPRLHQPKVHELLGAP